MHEVYQQGETCLTSANPEGISAVIAPPKSCVFVNDDSILTAFANLWCVFAGNFSLYPKILWVLNVERYHPSG